MSRIWRVGVPAFAAVIVLLAAVLVEVWMTMTGRLEYHVDIIFNIVFVGIAVLGGILVGLPTKTQNEWRLAGLLSNLLVSILAFPMNIAVFGHKVNWSIPLKYLWGGHIGWLLCAALQILFLSGLGEHLMSWVRRLLALGVRVTTAVGRGVSEVVEAVRTHDQGIITIMTVSTVVWAVFLAFKVYRTGTGEVLADADTLVGSLLVWIACILTGAVVYTAPLIIRRVRETVRVLNPQWLLIALLAVIALAVLSAALPSLLEAAGLLMTVLIVPLCLAGLIMGGAIWRIRRNRRLEAQNLRPAHTINPWDLAIVLLAFCVAPLTLLNVATALSPEGQAILGRGQVDMNTCLDYFAACCNAASAVMQLLA